MNADITEKEKEEEEEENMEAEEMIRETTERPAKKGRKSRNEMKKIDKEWKQFVRKNKGKFMELKLECEQRFGRSRAMVGKYLKGCNSSRFIRKVDAITLNIASMTPYIWDRVNITRVSGSYLYLFSSVVSLMKA